MGEGNRCYEEIIYVDLSFAFNCKLIHIFFFLSPCVCREVEGASHKSRAERSSRLSTSNDAFDRTARRSSHISRRWRALVTGDVMLSSCVAFKRGSTCAITVGAGQNGRVNTGLKKQNKTTSRSRLSCARLTNFLANFVSELSNCIIIRITLNGNCTVFWGWFKNFDLSLLFLTLRTFTPVFAQSKKKLKTCREVKQ